MLLFALLAVGASAAEDAPVISLDLSGTAGVYSASHATHSKANHNPLTAGRHYDASQYNSARTFADEVTYPDCAGSTVQCGFSSNPVLPTATGFDHHESTVPVTSTVTLFSEMEECVGALSATDTCASESNLVPKSEVVTWASATVVRGQYVVDYQASDASGNDADAVLFALIIVDHTCPTASLTTTTVEYGAATQTVGLSAFDNYDTAVLGPTSATFTTCQATTVVTSAQQTATFADYAGIFGVDNADNSCDSTFTLNIVDETPPVIDSVTFTGTTPGEHECATSTGANSDISAATVAAHDPNVVAGCYGHADSKANYFSFATPTFVDTDNTCADLRSANDHTWAWGEACTATYYAADKSSNDASAVSKSWTVKDSFDPTVVEPADHIAVDEKHHKDFSFTSKSTPGVYVHAKHDTTKALNIQVNSNIDLNTLDDYLLGMSCADTCGGGGGQATWSPSNGYEWVTSCTDGTQGNPFNATVAASYYLKFTCVDDSGRSADICRTIENVGAKPILSINCPSYPDHVVHDEWCDQLTMEAHGVGTEYVDAGAVCSDVYGDGDNSNHDMINERVIVSGDVVQMSVADTYRITYECSSAFDNSVWSEPAVRTVIITDNSAPTCEFPDDSENFVVEASFPYEDVPPTCTDVSSTGISIPMQATVTTGSVDVELTGAYVLTYEATDINNNSALFYRTVTVSDTLAPTIQLDLGNFGLMAESSSNGWLIGAMVSAVTGVALISFSVTRKVSTSVPV